MSNILKSRKNKKIQQNINKIDKLSCQLIGNISSFLNMRSYTNFEKCNRSIYIGCNSPHKLEVIPKTMMLKYPHIVILLHMQF